MNNLEKVGCQTITYDTPHVWPDSNTETPNTWTYIFLESVELKTNKPYYDTMLSLEGKMLHKTNW